MYFQNLEIDNVTVLTSRQSYKFFVDQDHVEMVSAIEKSSYLIAPICLNNNHWTCVLIDIKQFFFFYFDPLGILEEMKHRDSYFERWLNYYSSAFDESTKKKDWSNKSIPHPRQADKDVTNCGVFICLFISRYLERNEIQFETKPSDLKKYRCDIENIISKNSSVMTNLCSICGNKVSVIDESVELTSCKSKNCNLYYHKSCLQDYADKSSYMKKLSCLLCNYNF